jgi:hypothetical protein
MDADQRRLGSRQIVEAARKWDFATLAQLRPRMATRDRVHEFVDRLGVRRLANLGRCPARRSQRLDEAGRDRQPDGRQTRVE